MIFFDDLEIQIIEIDGFHETILVETGTGMIDEISLVGIKPYGYCKIELITEFFQSSINLLGSGHFVSFKTYDTVFEQMIFFDYLSPDSKHVTSVNSLAAWIFLYLVRQNCIKTINGFCYKMLKNVQQV